MSAVIVEDEVVFRKAKHAATIRSGWWRWGLTGRATKGRARVGELECPNGGRRVKTNGGVRGIGDGGNWATKGVLEADGE